MLSDRERHELTLIEEGLRSSDRRFADGFETRPKPPRGRRRWAVALLAFGVFCAVMGVLTSTEMLVVQGLTGIAAGVGWLRWQAVRAARAVVGGDGDDRPGARPDGPPAGRGQAA